MVGVALHLCCYPHLFSTLLRRNGAKLCRNGMNLCAALSSQPFMRFQIMRKWCLFSGYSGLNSLGHILYLKEVEVIGCC